MRKWIAVKASIAICLCVFWFEWWYALSHFVQFYEDGKDTLYCCMWDGYEECLTMEQWMGEWCRDEDGNLL